MKFCLLDWIKSCIQLEVANDTIFLDESIKIILSDGNAVEIKFINI